jgi:RNA polymerase subunit RPABC4/transcription elongation factor Spt4
VAFCINCGAKLGEGVKFCSGCGTLAASAGGVEIKQEKAVNYIQAQSSVLPDPAVPLNQNTPTVFCTNCGAKLEEGVKFCSGCGSPAASPRIEIKQEKAVNYIQAQPAVFPVSTVSLNNNTSMSQTIGADEKYCFSCGSPIKKAAEICPKCGVNQNARNSTMAIDVYCTSCGRSIKKEAATCPFCGVAQASTDYPPGYVPKNWTTALLLLIFLGTYGGHRFYVGKAGTAILMLIISVIGSVGIGLMDATDGISGLLGIGCIVIGIWWIIDLVQICNVKFTDKQGYPLKKKEK